MLINQFLPPSRERYVSDVTKIDFPSPPSLSPCCGATVQVGPRTPHC